MKGRKPVPTELRLLRGNPRQHAINKDEPKPEPAIPAAPPLLSKPAKEEWDRITAELNQIGLLTQIDRAALTIYCTAWGRFVEAETHLRAEGTRPEGKRNAWTGVSNQAIEQMRSMLGEFGLTPSARTRLSVKPSKSKEKESLFG
jgi:P27 family predicted phage terminase small subunit